MSANQASIRHSEDVLANLRSVETITAHTIDDLRALLAFPRTNRSVEAAPVTNNATRANAAQRSGTGKVRQGNTSSTERTKTVQKPAFKIHESQRQTPVALGTAARRSLAANAFNTSLKTLTSVVKSRQDEGLHDKSCRSARPAGKTKKNPLQEFSPNRQAKTAGPKNDQKDEIVNTGMLAECAQIALETLRALQPTPDPQNLDDYKLEKGALILVEKLVSLKLADVACLELSRIHEQYWKRRKDVSGASDVCVDNGSINGGPPVQLHIGGSPSEDYIQFVLSYQSQILRVAILQGPKAITALYIDSLRFTSSGSPANVIISLLKAQLISAAKAGEHLRTIAQAMLKLYSVAITGKDMCAELSNNLLNLIIEALIIKSESWSLLNQEPQLDGDFWKHIHKALKRIDVQQRNANQQESNKHFNLISCASAALKRNGFDGVIPVHIINTLVDLAEGQGDIEDGLEILQSSIMNPTIPNTGGKAILHWRVVTLQYRHSKMRDKHLLDILDNAFKSLIDVQCPDLQAIEFILLYGTRLRKTLSAIVGDVNRSSVGSNLADIDSAISFRCLEILARLLGCMSKLLQSQNLQISSDTRQVAFTSCARTHEAALEVYQFCSKACLSLQSECDEVLQGCTQISKLLLRVFLSGGQHKEILTFIESLLVKTSQLYWVQYVELGSQAPTAEGRSSPLEISCSTIKDLSKRSQKSAQYGMKLERLALAYLAETDIQGACSCFEEAVEYYMSIGALDGIAEAVISSTAESIWSRKGSASYSLGKILPALAKLRLTYELNNRLTRSWIYDEAALSKIERSLLVELQLSAVGDHKISMEQNEALKTHVHSIFDMSEDPKWTLHCLGVLSRLLHTMSKNSSISDEVLPPPAIIHGLIGASQCTKPSNISNCVEFMRCLIHVQLSFQHSTVDILVLTRQTKAMASYLSSSENSASLANSTRTLHILLGQLDAVLGYARSLDKIELIIICLETTHHVWALTTPSNVSRAVETQSQLGELYQRLGRIKQSEKHFKAAKDLLEKESDTSMVYKRAALLYVGYQLDNGSTGDALKLLDQVTSDEGAANFTEACTGRNQLDIMSVLSMSAHLASTLALQFGDISSANQYARQAVKLSTQIWQDIERQHQHVDPSKRTLDASSIYQLTTDLSSLKLTDDSSHSLTKVKGNTYWAHIDLHFRTLHQLVCVSLHNGVLQDTLYYAEQVRKLAVTIGSDIRLHRASALLASIHAKAGNKAEALNYIKTAELKTNSTPCAENDESTLLLIEAILELGETTKAEQLLKIFHVRIVAVQTPVEHQQEPKSGIKKAPMRPTTKPAKTIKQSAKRPGNITQDSMEVGTEASKNQLTKRQRILLGKYHALKHRIALNHKMVLDSSIQLDTNVATKYDSADNTVTMAMVMLRQGLDDLSSDAVKCVLAETAVALPVRYRSSRKSGRVSFVHVGELPAATRSARGGRGKNAKSTPAATKQDVSAGEKLIFGALKLLNSLQDGGPLPIEIVHVVQKLQTRLSLLTSTMSVPFTITTAEMVFQALVPKNVVQQRECAIVQAERATRNKAQLLTWPDITSIQHQNCSETNTNCNLDDLKDIPESWSIITLSLAETHEELLLSKITANRSPFLLRVPLSRSEYETEEEQDFSFEGAKTEFLDVVTRANDLAHDPRGQGEREARRDWYAEREELDQALESWLLNIENIWLGGFRSLLCSRTINDELLARFGQMLNQALDKHLPSRQKSGATQQDQIALHAHILELFLGLGHPDEQEIDDATTDLLYFVIDILQFSGERNAYDEIDFDAMLVDVFDAMRVYHGTGSQTQPMSSQHTILIVDKELAAFPWESLPCLKNQSVSRMPSLSSITKRLKIIREQCTESAGYYVSTSQGAYILNPSSDLMSTQSTFQPVFESQLLGFDSTVNTAPSEAEFTNSLATKDLLLYLGHGSGAQYIRPRTIRNLDTCAVTLLLGCSSAKMTECGKFESHGMPGCYIGGMSDCMAVVGTLWDVTDRDIDRFALQTMVEWGLIEEDKNVSKALERSSKKLVKSAGKGKVRSKTMKDRKGVVSLDEAVNKGRDACLLRYLNGAAPVVYGVPVFLR